MLPSPVRVLGTWKATRGLDGLEAVVEVVHVDLQELALVHGGERLGLGLPLRSAITPMMKGSSTFFFGPVKLHVILDLDTRAHGCWAINF